MQIGDSRSMRARYWRATTVFASWISPRSTAARASAKGSTTTWVSSPSAARPPPADTGRWESARPRNTVIFSEVPGAGVDGGDPVDLPLGLIARFFEKLLVGDVSHLQVRLLHARHDFQQP